MIDPLAAVALALTSPSPAALALVFAGGIVTSIGPCVAPRYLAIASIAGRDRHPFVPTLAYVGGLIGAFTLVGFAGGLLGTLWSASGTIDAVLAVALVAGGCTALVRAEPRRENHAECCSAGRPAGHRRSIGAIFLLGAASALVVSPCCTPVLATIAAATTATGEPLLGALLLALFGAGHALPLLFTGHLGAALARWAPRRLGAQVPAIVSAVLMLALGLYYAVIA
jgi:cytochrome c-type biogenesis protein